MLARLSRWTRRLRRQHGLALLGLGLVAYFGYHAVSGSRGLLAWREVNAELAASQRSWTRCGPNGWRSSSRSSACAPNRSTGT